MDFLFVLISIAVITVLIVVHEFGHFLTARYFGFQTPIFGIGLPFGPHIDLFKKWGTQFRFYWFLIGGFVSIPELGDETNEEMLKELDIKQPLRQFPVWQRAIVASGGIIFNVLFAFLLAVIMAPTIGIPKALPESSVAGFVSEASVAKQAGLKAGDLIIKVNDQDIADGNQLKETIQALADQDISLTVERKASEESTDVQILDYELHSPGALGIVLGHKQEYVKYGMNPITWFGEAFKFTMQTLYAMFMSIIAIFAALATKIIGIFGTNTEAAPVDLGQVKGIVGIVQLISEDIKTNWKMLFDFSILLSLNLAVINVLPIPALDGGHLMFMLYESIRGKKLSGKIQETALQFGFLFLLSVIALTTFNDFKNWIF